MGRPKGGKNRYWSHEEKLRIVKSVIQGEYSLAEISRTEKISHGMLSTWVKRYYEFGDEGLINKVRPGNPLAKYQSRKNLSEIELLQYENMKLKIENERLKKGYTVKGDGQNKKFISINKENLK